MYIRCQYLIESIHTIGYLCYASFQIGLLHYLDMAVMVGMTRFWVWRLGDSLSVYICTTTDVAILWTLFYIDLIYRFDTSASFQYGLPILPTKEEIAHYWATNSFVISLFNSNVVLSSFSILSLITIRPSNGHSSSGDLSLATTVFVSTIALFLMAFR